MHRTDLQRLTNIIYDSPDAFAAPRDSLPKTINKFKAGRGDLKKGLRVAIEASTAAYEAEQQARKDKSPKLQSYLDDVSAELADNIVRNDQGLKFAIIKHVLSRWASEETLGRLKAGDQDDVGYENDVNTAVLRAYRVAHPMVDSSTRSSSRRWRASETREASLPTERERALHAALDSIGIAP